MSQIAVFTSLRAKDVPFLGFWSKPKLRFFRRPESKFDEFLERNALRQVTYTSSDGVYVALVFAWIDQRDVTFSRDANIIIETVRKHVSGSHWLVRAEPGRLLPVIGAGMTDGDWCSFLGTLGVDSSEGYRLDLFESARRFVHEQLSAMQAGEALLVSVG